MKKECPRCSCYAEPIKADHNEYCVMCEWEVNTTWKKEYEEEEQ